MPTIISQIVNLLYSVVDRMFVGHIQNSGTMELTALGICIPIITLVSSFAQLVSSGAAPLASIMLGRKDKNKTEQILGNSFSAMFLMSLFLTITILMFSEQILTIFGASYTTMPYASSYLRIYACGNIFVLLTLGLNAFITAQGFSKVSITTVLLGAIVNIILDAIFIYIFNWGINGAAVATVIAQGAQPILSYNYGAGNTVRVRETFKWLICSAFSVTLIIYMIFLTFPNNVIEFFTSDENLILLTRWGIRIYFTVGILIGIQMSLLQTLMVLGKAGISTFLSLLRKVFLLIPFIYIFPLFMADKVLAVIISEPIADIISITATIIIFTIQFKKL